MLHNKNELKDEEMELLQGINFKFHVDGSTGTLSGSNEDGGGTGAPASSNENGGNAGTPAGSNEDSGTGKSCQ